jgi:predicted nucleic acid-binding Zn ribbon protein
MVEKVAQHTHCQICGKAIPITETLCSEECKQRYQTMVKKRKMLVYIMYGLIAFILVLFLFGSI